MYALLVVLAAFVFAIGVLVGVRCQEINLAGRERRLTADRRRVNDKLRAIGAYHEVNNIIWEAQDELRRNALVKAQDLPFVLDHELDFPPVPSQRNGRTHRPAPGRNNGTKASVG